MPKFTLDAGTTKDMSQQIIETRFEMLVREMGGKVVDSSRYRGNIKSLQRGVIGAQEEVYEIEGEGRVVIQRVFTTGNPGYGVELKDFDEESDCYKGLVKYLKDPENDEVIATELKNHRAQMAKILGRKNQASTA